MVGDSEIVINMKKHQGISTKLEVVTIIMMFQSKGYNRTLFLIGEIGEIQGVSKFRLELFMHDGKNRVKIVLRHGL